MVEGALVHAATGRVLADRARLAASFFERLVGAMGRTLAAGEAIGIDACDRVHSLLVPGPLDLAFCDAGGTVLSVVTLAPQRIGPRVRGARVVWEMAAGQMAPSVAIGDRLAFAPAGTE